ncbi:uncharacterized protein Rab32 isoform X1 [Anabrus simplex]|uniref:uncharacterized protein Rab32 isoform X1 n=1 Tax=Anabrus simplex TaxID=316456 RepID=UPI0035A26D01
MLILDCAYVLTPSVLKQIERMEKKIAASESVAEDSANKTASNSGAIPKASKGDKKGLKGSIKSVVGKSASFKLGSGRKKSDGEVSAVKEEEKPKKRRFGKKEKSKVVPGEETGGSSAGSQSSLAASSGGGSVSPPVKSPKTSKASSLARKLSIGRYRQHSKSTTSPTSESPELSPTMSKIDVSQEDLRSVTSSTSTEGRQGPEGDDGSVFEETPVSTPPVSPPPATKRASDDQSGQVVHDQVDQSADELPTPAVEPAKPLSEPVVEAVKVSKVDEAAVAPTEEKPATPTSAAPATTQDVLNDLLSELVGASSPAATSVDVSEPKLMSELPKTATTTKSQILSITTPAVKKQQQEEEARTVLVPHVVVASDVTEEEEQFGDLDEQTEDSPTAIMSVSTPSPSAPSADDAIAEARDRMSQSLGSGAQQVGEKREHLYKILVIGELGTGKTSIIKRYVHQFFSQHYRATIGVDFALKVLNWDTNTIIRLQLWDIAGQERFGNMTRVYYKEAVGAFIVFDVTRAATFDAVVKWKQDLDAKVQLPDGSPIPCILLANKCDQQKEGIVNNTTKMDEYCKERGFTAWYETSAKENINIEDAARCLVTKILQNDKLIHNNDAAKDAEKFALDGKAQKEQKNGKSCAC